MMIRTAHENDLPTLLDFEQEIVAVERPFDSTLTDGEIRYYNLQQLLLSASSEVIVIEVDNEIIASGYAVIKEAESYLKHSQFAYFGFMYVKPTYRGKGINQAVLNALTAWATSKGIHEIRLDVYAENSTARKAYEKAGFKPHVLQMRMEI